MTSLIRETRTHGLKEALLGGTGLREVGRLEGFVLRFLFAVVVWRSLEFYPAYPTAPKPVGLAAWLIARLTHGDLPGHLRHQPVNVAVVGDEDAEMEEWRERS
mgnify:CR=1 FL=1